MADERQLALRDEVAVETTLDGTYVSLSAAVTNILSDAFWLALPYPDARLAALVPGQSVHLAFDRRDGRMVLEARFLRRLGGNSAGSAKARVFAVSRPPGVETERRADVRVELSRGVRIRAASPDTARGFSIGTGTTINISAGGLAIATDAPLEVADQVTIAVALTARLIVTAGALVVRVEEDCGMDAGPAERRPRVAVRFTRISEADRERIACYILAARRLRHDNEIEQAVRADGSGDRDA